jgi:hypothetical protein
MNPSGRLTLQVRIPGIASYEIGDEIWQQSLAEAIEAEADAIAMAAGAELLPDLSEASRAGLRARVIAEMTDALTVPGDRYTAPDGVLYSLTEESALDAPRGEGRLSAMGNCTSEPIVEEVLRFEDVPLGSPGTRHAIVRWSDGTEDAAMTWYSDEILVCEGDLVGKTRVEIRSLHFRRDRDWLQS